MNRILLAALAALGLSAAAQAATLQSGSAIYQHFVPVPTSPNTAFNVPDGENLVAEGRAARLNIAQFDPVFGTLTGVDLFVDFSSRLTLDVFSDDRDWMEYRTSMTILSRASGGQVGSTTSFAPGIATRGRTTSFTDFRRSVAQITLTDVASFVGTRTEELDVISTQVLRPFGGESANFSGFYNTILNANITELVANISVQYTFTPGVQTVGTQAGLVAFSSSFVPEIVFEREGLTVVPLPAGVWLLLAGIGGLGALARRWRG